MGTTLAANEELTEAKKPQQKNTSHFSTKNFSSLDLNRFEICACFLSQTRTDSVQKVCGGVWQGFDHLTKLESLKVEVVLQGEQRCSSTL